MKSNLFLSPVAVGVLGVAIALSVVVGIVVNYTSKESTVIDTTAANRLADLQQAAGQSGSNVGVAFAAELPEFELKATPEPLSATAEPDALIWWDAEGNPTSTTAPSPTVEPTPTPLPTATSTPWPTPLPTVAPRYHVVMTAGQYHDWPNVQMPDGQLLPCNHLARSYEGHVFAHTGPLRDWFNALPLSERQVIESYCR